MYTIDYECKILKDIDDSILELKTLFTKYGPTKIKARVKITDRKHVSMLVNRFIIDPYLLAHKDNTTIYKMEEFLQCGISKIDKRISILQASDKYIQEVKNNQELLMNPDISIDEKCKKLKIAVSTFYKMHDIVVRYLL